MALAPGKDGHDGHGGLKAEINVTPLVDVVLVLLIIFMVITPILSQGKEVALPSVTSHGPQQAGREPLVLSLTADKRVWLEAEPLQGAELAARVTQRLKADGARELLIKADASLSLRELRPILQELKQAGVKRISFAVLADKVRSK